MISIWIATSAALADPTVVACKFDRLPLMVFMFRGASESGKSTLQIGDNKPVPVSVGSSLVSASARGQHFTFSLRLPASVTVTAPGSDAITYDGECVSTLPSE